MDPFAQSREDDDLFADEFEPVAETASTVDESQTSIADNPRLTASEGDRATSSGPIPAGPGSSRQTAPSKQSERRREGQERRPRGGRGGSHQNGLSQSRYAPQAESTPASAPSTAQPQPLQTSTSPTTNTTSDDSPTPQSATQNTAPIPEPSGRTPAVRGDRSATGGPAHKKLTEEELTAKLEKMAILNAQKAERHRLSEADQAAFQHREKELAKERREKAVAEKKNERVMEMERAKNRERKMKAQGGREWDSEKTEADIVDRKGRTSEYVRGGHGGVIRGGLAGSRYSTAMEGEEINTQPAKRGGGFEIRGRGGRGGRGGGRGGKTQPTVPVPEDFPPLSSAPVTTPAAAGDWAEEMATPVEEKKMNV